MQKCDCKRVWFSFIKGANFRRCFKAISSKRFGSSNFNFAYSCENYRASFVILGSGSREQEEVSKLADSFPEKVGVKIGFDESMARRIFAGSIFLSCQADSNHVVWLNSTQ